MEEVEKIDKFYMKMYEEYKLEYEVLSMRYNQKMNNDSAERVTVDDENVMAPFKDNNSIVEESI